MEEVNWRFSATGLIIVCTALAFVKLSCGPAQCQNAERGREVFLKLKCSECHSVAGKGGCLGPALDGVTKRRDATYIRLRLNKDDEDSFIKLIGHPELLPHPRFNKAQVSDLVSYLKTLRPIDADNHIQYHQLPQKNAAAEPAKTISKPSAKSIAEGKTLLYRNGCLACHSVGELGGSTGPHFDGISSRRSRQSIEDMIASPQSNATTPMPRANLSDSERRKITDYLLTLPPSSKKKA